MKIDRNSISSMGVVLGENTKETVESMYARHNFDFMVNGSFFWTSADMGWQNITLNTVVSDGKLINHTDVFSQFGFAVRNSNQISFEKFNKNDKTIEHFIGGSPVLVRGGIVDIDHRVDGDDINHPRSAIGVDDNSVYLLTVDGRTVQNKGSTVKDMAQHLCNVGVKYAINLDGGGSTVLFGDGRLLNRVDKKRKIPNAIGVKLK